MREKKRISPIAFRNGTRRPEVFTLQRMLNTVLGEDMAVDGWAGRGTAKYITAFQDQQGLGTDGVAGADTQDPLVQLAKGVDLNLMRVIQSIICWYETSSTRNSYGDTSLLDDGAGTNYGVLQHNSLGSLVNVLYMGGRKDLADQYKKAPKDSMDPEIKSWMGGEDGIKAQNKYFEKHVWDDAYKILRQIPDFHPNEAPVVNGLNTRYMERAWLLVCDSIVQNGALWSPKRKPFWNNLTDEERKVGKYCELYEGKEWDKHLAEWIPYTLLKCMWNGNATKMDRKNTNRITMNEVLAMIPDYECKLIAMAEWRARSSSPKWWKVVQDRRLTDATGKGVVNGKRLDLARDYCFAEDQSTWND